MVQFRYSAICLALGISALWSRSSTGFSVPTKSSSCITTRSNSSVVRQLKTKLHQSPVIENKEKIITSDDIKAKEPFINDGLFGWMQPYLDLFGFVEGKTVYYGPGVPVDELKFPSTEKQQELRKIAREEMTNISMGERNRRREGGEIATMVAIFYALFSSIFLDDGEFSGHLARFAIAMVCKTCTFAVNLYFCSQHFIVSFFCVKMNNLLIYSLDCTNITIYQSLKNHNKQPLFFAVGYTKSADTGL
mmetsp:Transcript_9983/g.11614  ORF Transcript_9983/g.11614 Transcript_9983/m.11614 type:complete len:248 (-) Transcript_9983:476-1219(-)